MNDASQEEKQNFLRETILERGYDTNLFVQFLTNKKGEEGADIGNWTMEDLKIIVREFIYLNGGPVEEENQNIVPQNQPEANIQEEKEKPIKNKAIIIDPLSAPKPKETNQKKISMFEVMGDSKPKKQVKMQDFIQVQNNNQIQTNIPPVSNETKEIKNEVTAQNLASQNQGNLQEQPGKPEIKQTKDNKIDNSNNKESIQTNERNEMDIKHGIIIPEIKKCQLNESTELSKYEIVKISVCEPMKMEGGFFSKSYITYLVKTEPSGKQVRRKYSDFVWLRQTLASIFISNAIPQIPGKGKMSNDRFGESFINKRMRCLEKFLNLLTKDPLIKNSHLLYDFLSIKQEADFTNIKKGYEKVKQFSEVQEFKSINGQINMIITPGKELFIENIKDNAIQNINLFKKLNYSMRLLHDDMDVVINRMEEISKIWVQLYKMSQKYFDDSTVIEGYNQMSTMFSAWGKTLKDLKKVVNVDIREYAKFTRNNFNSIKDFANSIDNQRISYLKSSKNLIARKEDLFKKGDTTKWDLDPSDQGDVKNLASNKALALTKMCHKETLNVIGLKEFYGYFLNRVISEYERMRNLNGIMHKENITKYCNRLTEILRRFHECLGQIVNALEASKNIKSDTIQCQKQRIHVNLEEL